MSTHTVGTLAHHEASGAARRGRPGRPRLAVLVMLAATFMQLVDVSIINVAIPSLQHDLGAGPGVTELVASGYTLAFACTLIPAGRLGDRHGYRRLFAIGMAVFTAASAACTLAPSADVLVVSRVVQGAGCGLMGPQVYSLIQAMFPPKERARVFARYGTVIGLGSVCGSLLGGVLITAVGTPWAWRLIFAVNLPIGVAALVGVRFIPHIAPRPAERLDRVGTVLLATSLGLLVYPLGIGQQEGWPGWVFAMLLCSPLLLGVFLFHQRSRLRNAASPLLHLDVLNERTVRRGLLLVFAYSAGVLPAFLFLSVYLQQGFGFSALQTGLVPLPFALAAAVTAHNAAPLLHRYGHRVLVAAAAIMALSMASLAVIAATHGLHPHLWYFAVPVAVAGIGHGLYSAATIPYIVARVRPEATGTISGMLPTATQVASCLGIALAGIAFYALLGSAGDPHHYAKALAGELLFSTATFALAAIAALRLKPA